MAILSKVKIIMSFIELYNSKERVSKIKSEDYSNKRFAEGYLMELKKKKKE